MLNWSFFDKLTYICYDFARLFFCDGVVEGNTNTSDRSIIKGLKRSVLEGKTEEEEKKKGGKEK